MEISKSWTKITKQLKKKKGNRKHGQDKNKNMALRMLQKYSRKIKMLINKKIFEEAGVENNEKICIILKKFKKEMRAIKLLPFKK